MSQSHRYLVFGGEAHYPEGGWRDFLDSFESRDAATKFIDHVISLPEFSDGAMDWAHAVDSSTQEVVASKSRRHG